MRQIGHFIVGDSPALRANINLEPSTGEVQAEVAWATPRCWRRPWQPPSACSPPGPPPTRSAARG